MTTVIYIHEMPPNWCIGFRQIRWSTQGDALALAGPEHAVVTVDPLLTLREPTSYPHPQRTSILSIVVLSVYHLA
jgi:hypothetical protein